MFNVYGYGMSVSVLFLLSDTGRVLYRASRFLCPSKIGGEEGLQKNDLMSFCTL